MDVDVDSVSKTSHTTLARVTDLHGVRINSCVSVLPSVAPSCSNVIELAEGAAARYSDSSLLECTESELARTHLRSDQSSQDGPLATAAVPASSDHPSAPARLHADKARKKKKRKSKESRQSAPDNSAKASTSAGPLKIAPVSQPAQSTSGLSPVLIQGTSDEILRPPSQCEPERSSSRNSQASQQLRDLRDGSEKEGSEEPRPLPIGPSPQPGTSASAITTHACKRTGDQAGLSASPQKRARTPSGPARSRKRTGEDAGLPASPSK